MTADDPRDRGPRRRVAVVGTGTMGQPIAIRVLDAGHDVRVHDRSPDAITSLLAVGADAADDAAAAADGADVVLLSLPGPPEVVAAVTGPSGVLAAPTPPAVVVDLSTNAVATSRELHARCAADGVGFLDAPVSGGVAKARTGALAILVGGTEDDLAAARPVLECFGTPMHVGPAGAGSIAKIVNNQLFLAAGLAVQEAYVLGAALGMAPGELHRVIRASSAAPYDRLAPLLLGRRFEDVIFRLDIAAKDIALAVESAAACGVDVPVTAAGATVYSAAVDHGDGALVFHATLRELERRAGIELSALVEPT